MSKIQHPKTARVLQRTIFAALATSLLSACPPAKESGDGGTGSNKTDASVPVDASMPRDAAAKEDAGDDAGKGDVDAGMSALDGGADAAVKDAGYPEPDAYVPIDPITTGVDKPVLSKVAYLSDELGHRILIQGRDPNGDVASYTIKFFKGTTEVTYDTDNDPDTDPVKQHTNSLPPQPLEAGFFINFETSLEFTQVVDNVKVFVTDDGGRTSNELPAARMVTPTVASKCDPNGFDRCSGTNVCAKSGQNYVCTQVATARQNACNAALVLTPPTVSSLRAVVRGYSLWDIPPSCGTDATGLNDHVVKLRLPSAANRVVLSTENDYTNFDTVLYWLDQGCKNPPTSCAESTCFCSDDVPSPRSPKSRLVLENLPAGDHLIVVDTAASQIKQGDRFELSVTVE